jgi:hypothetical protein
VRKRAVTDASNGQALNTTALAKEEATLAYEWTTDTTTVYPTVPVPGYVQISQTMMDKYVPTYFSACG